MTIEVRINHEGVELPLVTFIDPAPGSYDFEASADGGPTFKGRAIVTLNSVRIDSAEFREHPIAIANAESWPKFRKRKPKAAGSTVEKGGEE